MKIAFIGAKTLPYPGGIEIFTEEVGWRLVERGHEVMVDGRQHYARDGSSAYRGIRLVHLPSLGTKLLDNFSSSCLATMHLLYNKVDIVHLHTVGLSVLSLWPRIRGTKTIVQVHGLDWEREKWGQVAKFLIKQSDYTTRHFPDGIAVVSKALEARYKGLCNRPVRYAPPGVDMPERASPDKLWGLGVAPMEYILFLGRPVPEKRCHDLLQAYREVQTTKRLVIVGDAPHTDQYTAFLRRLADGRTVFTGFVDDGLLAELISNAYLCVFTSEVEGMSRFLLQALSYGRCVLASDIEPNVEALGECGFTFRVGDREDLRSRLEYLLVHPEIVAAQDDVARHRVKTTYSWENAVASLEQFYIELVDGKGSKGSKAVRVNQFEEA